MSRFGILALRLLVVSAGLAPWLVTLLARREAFLTQLFHTLCHQRVERTLVVFGAPMVVCSRCAGLYAGIALGAFIALPRRWLGAGRTLVAASIAVTLVDVVTQDLGWHAVWHPVRLATGAAMGAIASAYMFGAIRSHERAAIARA